MSGRRFRLEPVLTWSGLVACGLLLLAWGLSLQWSVRYASDWNSLAVESVCVSRGRLLVCRITNPTRPDRWEEGWRVYSPGFPPSWLPGRGTASGTFGTLAYVSIPLWCFLLAAAIPVGLIWYRGRRIPPGRCQNCGYDLTGNTSGRCPECGEPC